MSGKKQATITVNLRYLRDLERRVRDAVSISAQNAALQQLVEATNTYMRRQETQVRSLNDRISSLNTELTQRDAAATEARRKLREQLERVVRDTNRAMETLSNTFNTALDNQRQETIEMIKESNRHLTDALNSAVNSLQNNINAVNNRVDDLENSIAGLVGSNDELLDLAVEYNETAGIIVRDIVDNYRTEILLPGRVAQAQAALQAAEQDINLCSSYPTNAPVAHTKARDAAKEAIRLRQDMLEAEQLWQAHLEGARNIVALTAQQLEASAEFTLPAPESKKPGKQRSDYVVNVDYWSNGSLTALKERLNAVRDQLSGDKPYSLSAEQIDALGEAAAQISEEITEVVTFATSAVTSSQSRIDYVAMMYRKLREFTGANGWQVSYEGGDQRAATRAHITNSVSHFEFVITAVPHVQADGTICNDIETDILDYGTYNQAEADAIADSVAAALAGKPGSNIEVSQIATLDGFEHRVSDRSGLSNIASFNNVENPNIPSPANVTKTPTTQTPAGSSTDTESDDDAVEKPQAIPNA